jgi:hypothetical protein
VKDKKVGHYPQIAPTVKEHTSNLDIELSDRNIVYHFNKSNRFVAK